MNEKKIQGVISGLEKATKLHAKQAKILKKIISDEKKRTTKISWR